MSDTGGIADGANAGMSAADVDFLITCLRNSTSGTIVIDTQAVADVKGFKNHRSVGNKILQLKKKYDLPFATGTGASITPKKAGDAAGSAEPAISKTPSKRPTRVTKAKTTVSSKKKVAVKPKAKKAAKEVEDEEMTDLDADADAEADAEDNTMAVKTPEQDDSDLDDEAVFGKKDSDEEALDAEA